MKIFPQLHHAGHVVKNFFNYCGLSTLNLTSGMLLFYFHLVSFHVIALNGKRAAEILGRVKNAETPNYFIWSGERANKDLLFHL